MKTDLFDFRNLPKENLKLNQGGIEARIVEISINNDMFEFKVLPATYLPQNYTSSFKFNSEDLFKFKYN